jgi:hypothetical protein
VSHAPHRVTLKAKSAREEDVYKDIVRITEKDRGDLKTGRIHKFKTSNATAYFILRGNGPSDDGKILIDEAARNKLNLGPSAESDFVIQQVGFWGELRWVWSATDPSYRIAGRLGVLSLFLGVLALGLGIAPLFIEAFK